MNAVAKLSGYMRNLTAAEPTYVGLRGVSVERMREIAENGLQKLHETDRTLSAEIERLTEQRRQTRQVIESQSAALRALAADKSLF